MKEPIRVCVGTSTSLSIVRYWASLNLLLYCTGKRKVEGNRGKQYGVVCDAVDHLFGAIRSAVALQVPVTGKIPVSFASGCGVHLLQQRSVKSHLHLPRLDGQHFKG